MNIDIKKIARSSIIFVGVGIILAILSVILQLVTLLITDSNAEIVQLAASVYSVVLIPLFLIMFLVAGYRAVKVHSLDSVGAGLSAAFSYVIIAVTHLFLNFLLSILVLSGLIPGGAGFGSSESVAASALFGDVVGAFGLGLQLVCGFGLIAIGALINFVIGGIGGILASR